MIDLKDLSKAELKRFYEKADKVFDKHVLPELPFSLTPRDLMRSLRMQCEDNK